MIQTLKGVCKGRTDDLCVVVFQTYSPQFTTCKLKSEGLAEIAKSSRTLSDGVVWLGDMHFAYSSDNQTRFEAALIGVSCSGVWRLGLACRLQ